MKKLWGKLGSFLFWLILPIFFVYLRYSGKRSRVMVIVGDEILLIKPWLGLKKYGLPGGGTKGNESTKASAVRELNEELGIQAVESSLVFIGSRQNKKYNLKYIADFYYLQLLEKPDIKIQKTEIFEASWQVINNLNKSNLDDEAIFAIKHYQPPEQPSLL